MSTLHPIIALTGSSGAGTSTARVAFDHIFRRLHVNAAYVEGDAFHRFDREQMKAAIQKARIRGENFSHFGPAANHLDRLESLFAEYSADGSGETRNYLHTEEDALAAAQPAGTFTQWAKLPKETDVLLYEGLHGGIVTEQVNVAQHVDLLIGVVPTVNLEWIQKICRDTEERGQSPEDVTRTILRRMPDYVFYITPQFSRTDINLQRVPLVDTSNPFIAREIPSADESMVVIRFARPQDLPIDFPFVLSMVQGSFMSRPNSIVVPGGKLRLALEIIMRPIIEDLIEKRKEALRESGKPVL